MAKKKELFILAANYLQRMDWHSNAAILTAIIQFYTKVRRKRELSAEYFAFVLCLVLFFLVFFPSLSSSSLSLFLSLSLLFTPNGLA